MNKPTQSLLRDHIVPPKATFEHFLKNAKSCIAFDKLQDEIWRELLNRFKKPIKHIHSKQHRIIEVLGCIRYYIQHDTGEIHSRVRVGSGNTSASFERENGRFLAVHPLRLTEHIIRAFIRQWQTEILKNTHQYITTTKFETIFVQSLLRAVRQSVLWKQLRYQVQEALGIDSQILDIACRARTVRHKNNLDDTHFNRVIKHLEKYQQLNREAPNLLWLYTLTLQEYIELPEGELIQELKKLCLKAGTKERGWRLITRSHLRDFAPAVEFSGSKWKYFIEYVQLHNTLDLNAMITSKASHLFDEPYWNVEHDGTVTYRGVNLLPATLNSYIHEASNQRDINAFLTSDATAVFVWLSEVKPKLDNNQIRLGWRWLSHEANCWLAEKASHAKLNAVRWECGLGETVVGGYKFAPLSNAWLVRQEALRYRHCADNYIKRCIDGTYRIYGVYDSHDKHKATLGIQFNEGNGWAVHQIKGFANQAVSNQLKDLAHSLSAGLDIINEGAKARTVPVVAKDNYSLLVRCGNANLNDHENDVEVDVQEDQDNLCPICHEEAGCCGHHVACYDRYGEGIGGGVAYHQKEQWLKLISDIFQYYADHDLAITGLGSDFDIILADLNRNVLNEQADFSDLNYAYIQSIEHAICELIAADTDVYSTVLTIDEMPGMSSIYDNYWANDPAQVVQRIDEFIATVIKVILDREKASHVCANKVTRKLLDLLNADYLNRECPCDADKIPTLIELKANEKITRVSSTGIYLRTVNVFVCSVADEPDNVFAIEHISRGRIVGIKGPWSAVEYAKAFYARTNNGWST